MTAVDPITTWSSFLASPAAPKTAMSALELDGYLTGVIVTPQAVPVRPSAWIGRLWGDDEPIFEDDAQIDAALGAVALRYNALIRDIDRSLERLEAERIVDYRPLFVAGDQKPSHDAVRIWACGFFRAMALAPATWSKLVGTSGPGSSSSRSSASSMSAVSIQMNSPTTSTICSTPRPP
jgi:uncharacterized protein